MTSQPFGSISLNHSFNLLSHSFNVTQPFFQSSQPFVQYSPYISFQSFSRLPIRSIFSTILSSITTQQFVPKSFSNRCFVRKSSQLRSNILSPLVLNLLSPSFNILSPLFNILSLRSVFLSRRSNHCSALRSVFSKAVLSSLLNLGFKYFSAIR
ncbi:hypothetical protein AVEN_204719-1 [Araneus ventricosus]|uniref:Uncharacterized protein n=1 Tax=Araneus ventricosus TaxID=182803 RepID=A0A4Y2H4L0_ARAVE|nr:hypothetical protein AVEN_204719-1 [Araneus ventricosus]